MNKKRILLVDDDEILLTTFRLILQEEGYFVETAKTGQQAIDKAKQTKFHLGIIDINLPDIMGDKVASKLNKQYGNMTIIFITGYPHFQDCIDALDIGVYEILLKPISPDELLLVTKEALSTRTRAKYWMGKNPLTRKAVIEYRSKRKSGHKVTMQKISKKYRWRPAITTIQKHVSKLKKSALW